MMTVRTAARIMAVDVDCYPTPNELGWIAEANLRDIGEAARTEAKSKEEALEKLVDLGYRMRVLWVCRQQGWRCYNCGAVKPLEGHHKKFRSHGRVDVAANLVALCCACHGLQHG